MVTRCEDTSNLKHTAPLLRRRAVDVRLLYRASSKDICIVEKYIHIVNTNHVTNTLENTPARTRTEMFTSFEDVEYPLLYGGW